MTTIPKQVADKMRKTKFRTFQDFREKFWTFMADDPVVKDIYTKKGALSSLEEMKNGRAPFAFKDQRLVGRGSKATKVQFNHQIALEHAGDDASLVYNLELVTPQFHVDITQ